MDTLKTSCWAWFALGGPGGLFDIKKGKRLTAADQVEGDTPYIGAIDSNNGVSNRIGQSAIHEGNTISLSYNGSVGEAFYQPDPYWSTDDVNALYLKSEYGELTPAIGLFVCTVLRQEKYRFSYGRKWTLDNMNATFIKLPVAPGGGPDWQFMEDFIKSLNHKPLTTENNGGAVLKLDTAELVDFNFGKLVSDVYKATAFTKDDLIEVPYTNLKTGGYLRYITRTALDNGCEMLVAREKDLEDDVEAGNAISIGDTTATCFYQSEDFVAGDHMVVVRAGWLNPFTGNFIATLLNRESYRYSYGRAFVMESIKATDLKLPIKRNPDGTPVIDPKKSFHDDGYIPDWQFMEDYMRSLPYGDRIPEVGD